MYSDGPGELIALINDGGQVAGSKLRSLINKQADVYHSIFVLCITLGRQLVLSKMPSRQSQRVSVTVATICRAHETPEAAAQRMVGAEQLHHLGDQFYTWPDGSKTYGSVYYFVRDVPENISNTHLLLTASELDMQVENGGIECTPALQVIWSHCRRVLPV